MGREANGFDGNGRVASQSQTRSKRGGCQALTCARVLAVGIIGDIMARFQSAGMAGALLATTLTQTLVPVRLGRRVGATAPNWPLDILGLTGLFAALWLISAWLFQESGTYVEPERSAV